MKNPFFSVIVPVYNVEKYLAECIESILNQTFGDFELILVDDGSTDKSPQICDEYAEKDQRIHVLHKTNGGHTSARRAGAEMASGEYVVSVDSDDWIEVELLQKLHDVIDKNDCDVVCYNYYSAGDELIKHESKYTEGLYVEGELEKVKSKFLYDDEIPGLNCGTLPSSICVKVVKGEIHNACQQLVPEDVVRGEDLLFTLHLFERCQSIYMLDYIGYYYRDNETSIVHTFKNDDIKKLNHLVQLILEFGDDQILLSANNAYVFAFATFWDLIAGFARQMKKSDEFVAFVKQEYTADFKNYFSKLKLAKYTLKDRIKLFLVKNQQWKLIYWYMNK